MSDTYSTVPGQGNAPGLPPVNLPSLGQPQARPRITVGMKPRAPEDPYAGFTEYQPEEAQAAPQGDPYAGFTEYTGPKEPPPEEKRYKYLPERVYETVKRFTGMPGRVMKGEVDPLSDEAIGAMTDLSMFANPATVARGTTAGISRLAGRGAPTEAEVQAGVPRGIAEQIFGPGKTVEARAAEEEARIAAQTSGQRAAETTAALGKQIGRGFTSDSGFVQSLTARLMQFPIIGSRLAKQGQLSVKAAGNKLTDIVEDLTPTPGRVPAAANIKSGMEDVIKSNNKGMATDYDELRNAINPDQIQPMPALDNAVKTIKLQRQRSGARGAALSNGLSEVETLAREGGGFNGAHQRRQILDQKISYGEKPDISERESLMLRGAIKQDLRNSIIPRSAASPSNPNLAQSLFDSAELKAGQRLEENKTLRELTKSPEATVEELIGAAKEKRGNVRLLAQLRNSMAPEKFEQVSGTLLHSLGRVGDNWSLARFNTEWGKLSPEAKNVLFSPQHQKWIDDIASLGGHLKDVTKYENHSNTAGTLMLFEMGQMAIEGSVALSVGGGLSPTKIATGVIGGAASLGLMQLLASPAKAAAFSAWVKAYRAISLQSVPAPAKVGVFMAANRNLAHNLGLDPNAVLRVVQQGMAPPAQAQP